VPLNTMPSKLRVVNPQLFVVIRCGTPNCDWGHKMRDLGVKIL